MRKILKCAAVAIALLCLPALGGCGFTSEGQAVRQGVATYGAQAMDEGLVNAEWFICRAASVGAVQRRYGKSSEAAEAWKTLCNGDGEAAIIEAPPD